MTASVTARRHNRVLEAGRRRADELEPKLARIVAPILDRVGRDAARQFRARATDHLTAGGEPTPWSAPAPDEILDVDALVKTLRTKTDPVRRAVVENVMRTTLDGAGIDFDVTNPFAVKALATAGARIRDVAVTTQLDVMRVIKGAYDEGLSIPDTAKLIRALMRHVATTRARTIARTELNSATNAAALAATQIVQSAMGTTFYKTWVATEDGATRPDHADADGQTVRLDEQFVVGGVAMDAPGDPAAPADETVSCRCTILFTDEGAVVSAA